MTSPIPERLAVQVAGLTYTYGSRTALTALSFGVRTGEIFGLLGPNGGGKTTLFRILSTLTAPQTGSVTLFSMDATRDTTAIRKRIGVVFQHPSVDGKLTVAENLGHQGHLYGLHGSPLRTRTDDLLQRFELSDRRNERVERLSGGLQRRVELAKALLHRPELLILDEPSSGLDPGARRNLWEYLSTLRERDGVTVLLTTHFLEEAEKCDRLAIVHEGSLVAEGTPAALKDHVGGDVIVIGTKVPDLLRVQIRDRFGLESSVVDGSIQIHSKPDGDRMTRLMSAFQGQIESITVRRPTLEDVFMQKTGRRFYEAPE